MIVPYHKPYFRDSHYESCVDSDGERQEKPRIYWRELFNVERVKNEKLRDYVVCP